MCDGVFNPAHELDLRCCTQIYNESDNFYGLSLANQCSVGSSIADRVEIRVRCVCIAAFQPILLVGLVSVSPSSVLA